jgi:hypothetical protein
VTFLPGETWPLYQAIAGGLLDAFQRLGHAVLAAPDATTDLLVSSAVFGQPLSWRQAPMLTARRRFKLDHTPTTVTLVHLTPEALRATLSRLEQALARDPIVPEDFAFDGLSPEAWRVLVEQGQPGGPMLALLRLIQAQTKCIRIVMVVGSDLGAQAAYVFDLAGAYPYIPFDAQAPSAFTMTWSCAWSPPSAPTRSPTTKSNPSRCLPLSGMPSPRRRPCSAPAASWASVTSLPRCCVSPIWYRSLP